MDITVNILDINDIKKMPFSSFRSIFPKRMERAMHYAKEDDRLRTIGAGVLIHNILGIKENDLYYNEHGKPKTDGKFFNISHSGDYVILVSSENEIGCDIEKIDKSHLRATKSIFLSDEQEWIAENPDERFFTLWTLKESIMKQQGLGITLPSKSFSVLPFLEGKPIETNKALLYGSTVKFKNYCISVCCEEPIDKIVIKHIKER